MIENFYLLKVYLLFLCEKVTKTHYVLKTNENTFSNFLSLSRAKTYIRKSRTFTERDLTRPHSPVRSITSSSSVMSITSSAPRQGFICMRGNGLTLNQCSPPQLGLAVAASCEFNVTMCWDQKAPPPPSSSQTQTCRSPSLTGVPALQTG